MIGSDKLYILESCSTTLGTCCNDAAIVSLVEIIRRIMNIIQLVVPILLIVYASIELTKMVLNPDEKNGLKKVTNKFFAAAIVFFVPMIINAFIQMMPNSYNLTACWNQSRNSKELLGIKNVKYKNPYEGKDKKTLYSKRDEYEKGEKRKEPESSATTSGGNYGVRSDGTVHGADIAAYAMQFKGMGYRLGCHWDGEIPYQNASCIGFVVGLYKHFGIKIHCTEDYDLYLDNPSVYTVVTNAEHHPGDIVVYDGHYAMLTGNGDEIIHSTSTDGIITTSSYKKSGMRVLGIVRVNGVI